MIGEHDPRRAAPPPVPGWRPGWGEGAPPREGASPLRRFLGGSPVTVFAKLLVLSVIVGAAMATLGLTPGLLFWHLYDGIRWLIDMGLMTFRDFGSWILAGAAVVVPVWLISRFLAIGR